ncbi:MAG: hypothetical protein COV80_02380 [Parcubacteria group bacterium CG11_big_fil_rev_8_21_14_0_20_48_46]|nr:MAG: hypothetical protein AUK21_03225 [Parcubacteria group bacterium CG2_30_48_51]PIW78952.1 MAG: hypothetical protein COZ99_03825 [Parcubacteria group bacterium CG_4_8_14_3_um_filter_48_16]PIY78157.1 MAG: hypothetical protein COY83_01205 [Parcubacteria group bacterium CG_4_10_14_0_8_um_filter_48_154]PIZ77864.1 MAG: hypothetical protein COY03_01235 [bacterium CG_4_10_14_0_2_um_filter_48_144]PJC39406.1 MAG: hypothetical protein CO043_04220 [Parcubacteria group bacterium CG_4_9_14_0_2_um_filte
MIVQPYPRAKGLHLRARIRGAAGVCVAVALFPLATYAKIPNDPLYAQQWYLEKINAPAAWDVSTGSRDVVVAVLDTGVATDHPDLQRVLWVNQKEILGDGIDNDGNGYRDDANGWDFIDDDASIEPEFVPEYLPEAMHHGTLVAGIIGAEGNNYHGITGVAWNVRIMPLRVLDSFGRGDSMRVRQAIAYAVAQGADVINMSFVGIAEDPLLAEAIADAYHAGVVVVAAAGNGEEDSADKEIGLDLATYPLQPVCLDALLGDNAVVGVAATDRQDRRAVFSNYGSSCVDIAAPGIDIIGAEMQRPAEGEGFTAWYGGYWNGTSASAPIISGAVALAKSLRPELSATALIAELRATAHLPYGDTGLGSGIIDLAAYLNAIRSATTIAEPPSPATFFPGDKNTVAVFAPSLGEIKQFNGSAVGTALSTISGSSLAYADVTRDGTPDLLVGARKEHTPEVLLLNRDGSVERSFSAYADTMRGGVRVAAGNVSGSGSYQIVTAPQGGAEPLVRIFSSGGELLGQFLAYAPTFHGGVSLAVGDVDGDGRDDIVTGAGPGGGPHVRIFDDHGNLKGQFFAYGSSYHGGIAVGVGKLASGAYRIVTAPLQGNPTVRIFDPQGKLDRDFLAYAPTFHGGVSLAVGDVDGDGRDDIVTGAGPGGGPHVRIFGLEGNLKAQYFSFATSYRAGIVVAVLH